MMDKRLCVESVAAVVDVTISVVAAAAVAGP